MAGAGVTVPLSSRQRLAVSAVLGAMALTVLDAGMANISLPGISRHLAVSPADAIIVVGAYQAALLAGLLPSSHIAGRIGHRRLFRAGIVLFATAGLLAALAPNLPSLTVARVFQGFGGAAIMALGVAVLRTTLGNDRLPQAIAWNALVVAISAAAGPLAGAVLLTFLPPQFLFTSGLPIAVGAVLAASYLDDEESTGPSIDLTAIVIHFAVVVTFLTGVRLAVESPVVAAASMAAGILAMWAQIRRSRPKAAPLFPFDLLSRRPFALQAVGSVCCFLAQSAGLIALSFSVQARPEWDPMTTGLLMACWPLAVAIANLVASRARVRVATPFQCAAGALTMAVGLMSIAITDEMSAKSTVAVGPILCGVGFGLFQLANNRALFLEAPAGRSAAAGGLQGTARLTGQTLGTFLVTILFLASIQEIALSAAAAAGAAFALLAALFSVLAGRSPFDRFSINSARVAAAS